MMATSSPELKLALWYIIHPSIMNATGVISTRVSHVRNSEDGRRLFVCGFVLITVVKITKQKTTKKHKKAQKPQKPQKT